MRLVPKDQFDRLLLSRDVVARLERLQEDGSLAAMFPEVQDMVGFGGGDTGHKDLWGHTKQVVAQCIPRTTVRWAALFHDVGKVRCFRQDQGTISFHGHESVSAQLFKRASERTRLFTPDEVKDIHFLVHHLGYVEAYVSDWTDSAVRRVYKHAGKYFDDLIALSRADITTKHTHKREAHHRRMKEFLDRALEIARVDAIPPALPTGLGEVLSKEFGVPPSAALGKLMQTLKDAVADGTLERQASIETVVKFVRDHNLV